MMKAVKKNLVILKFNRNWVDGEDTHKSLTIISRIINVGVQIFILYCIARKLVSTTNNLAVVGVCIFTICTTFPCLAKLFNLLYYVEVFKQISRKLEHDLYEQYKIDENEKTHIRDAEKFVTKYLTGYIVFTGICGCFGTLSVPLWKKILAYFGLYPANASVGFPFPVWSPFDENNDVGYAIIYTMQCYFFFSLWAIWVGTDVFSAGVIFHICGHFKIIRDRIKSWESDEKLNSEEISVMSERKRDLRSIISYHSEILNIGKSINEANSQALLHQLIFTSIIICCCGIQIIVSPKHEGVQNVSMTNFIVVCFMLCMLVSWWGVCFVGTKIITESQKVARAIYFRDWISLQGKERKDMSYILFRSQKPVYMTGGKFFVISLNLFLDVVKTSYSLLAVLREVYG